MMDGSTLAILAAGTGVIGVMAYAMLPRAEDYFELSMVELFELTSSSDRWPPDSPESGGRALHPQSLQGAPVCSTVSSYRGYGHGAAATDGLAAVQSSESVLFIHPVEGDGESISVQRDRQPLFLVSSK